MPDIDEKKILDEILDELSKEFKDKANDAKDELKYWGEVLVKLRIARINGDADEVKNAEKSEEYAWNAICALKAKYSAVLEEKAWSLAERILKVFRNVLLA